MRLLLAWSGLRSAAVTAYDAVPRLDPWIMLADIGLVDDTSGWKWYYSTTELALVLELRILTWYLILDWWWAEKNHSLNAHILPVPVQTILEDVDWPSINNFLCEFVPMSDYSVAEQILSGVQTASVDCLPFAVAPEIVSSVAEFKEMLHISTFSIPVSILKVSIRSPLILLLSSDVSPSLCNRDSYIW